MSDRTLSPPSFAVVARQAPRVLASLAVCLLASAFVDAQGAGLYPEPPPADSSYLRVVNARSATRPEVVTVGSTSFAPVAATEATDYQVFKGGALVATTAAGSTTIEVAPAKFFSIVLTDDGGLTLVEDPMNTSRAKVVLALYNLSDLDAVALKTADGKVAVVGDVAPLRVASASVNPIKVSLAVFSGARTVDELGERTLERGAVYSILVTGPATAPTVRWQVTRTVGGR